MHKYKLISMDKHTGITRTLRFQPTDVGIGTQKPGQFVFLHILDEQGNSISKKPYSIASSPGSEYLEFFIKMVQGQVTGKLEQLKIGDEVGVEGPFGHFVYENQGNTVFVGAGTGIAPFIGMARHISKNKIAGEHILFYSVKTQKDLAYRKELESFGNIKTVITLTQEKWAGETGRISKEMLQKYIKHPENANWWICGPMEMVKLIREMVVQLGVDPKKIKMEGWG